MAKMISQKAEKDTKKKISIQKGRKNPGQTERLRKRAEEYAKKNSLIYQILKGEVKDVF